MSQDLRVPYWVLPIASSLAGPGASQCSCPLTFDAELGEPKLAVMVPQHVMEILPRQLIPVLKPRGPKHGLGHLLCLFSRQAVVGDLDEGPGARRRDGNTG